MATDTASVERWVEQFRQVTDEDPEIQAHGRHYTCSFLLDMKESRYLVKMHAGKVEEILVNPGPLDERYQFALRASADTWRKFGEEIPEPMYHGIWSASFQRDLKLEGDILVLMQNLRCFTRQFELLRKTGVPV
ncbi:hypothetical protein [Rubrobacter calidifluminis]|uniref:hypothetical protein n=1 Tax=Rubrobacter calidifluminis TaxID=1392640 RepID=UPI002362FD99|nr:hypothetical protein [Rubrobacter calidifluminis]